MIAGHVQFDRFVGRWSEIEFLRARFAAVNAQRAGSVVLILGEAGLGKSRLLREFHQRIEGTPHSFAAAACHAYTRGALVPFIEILDGCVPGAASMLHDDATQPRSGAADRKHAVFEAALRSLAEAAAADPGLVVALEDLHWADSATLELFEHLARHIDRLPLLLVATFRSDAVERDERLVTLVPELMRCGTHVVRLEPLSTGALRTLTNSVVRSHAALPGDVVARIEDLSGGNPLRLEELLRDTLDRVKAGEPPFVAVPQTTKAVLLQRIGREPRRVRSLLTIASALGDTFSAALLARVACLQERHVVRLLQHAAESRLVSGIQGSPDRYRFRHALIRETLQSELTAAFAAEIHRSAATAIESSAKFANSTPELAYHWSAAAEASKAARYNEAAGDAARLVGGYRDAVRFFRQALTWCSRDSEPRLSDKVADALYCDGCVGESREYCERAIKGYVNAEDWNAAAALLSRMYAIYLYDADSSGVVKVGSIAAQVVEHLTDPALQSALLVRTATFVGEVGMRDRALALLDRVSSLSPQVERSDSEAALLHCLRADARNWCGDVAGAIAEVERALTLARQTTNHSMIATTAAKLADLYQTAGRLNDALDVGKYAYDYARMHRISTVSGAWHALTYASVLFTSGRLAEAESVLERTLENGAEFNGMVIVRALVGIPIALALDRSDLLARCADEEAIRLAFETNRAWCIAQVAAAFAELYVRRGMAREARSLLHRAAEAFEHRPLVDPLAVQFLIALAAYGDAEDVIQAQRLAAHLTARSCGAYLDGYVWYVRALLAAREGRNAERRSAALAASKSFQSVGMPVLGARTLELAGRQKEALAAFRHIGDVADASRLERLFSNRGNRGGTLTPRQLEIAQLIVNGAPPKTAARRLQISELTLKKHVAQIYRRLGIRSRAQLVAYLIKQSA